VKRIAVRLSMALASAFVASVAFAFSSSFSVRAAGAEPALDARVVCAPAIGPGRIVCEFSAAAPSGKLVWVDALVVKAPAFARPLRSRVVAPLAASGERGTASAKLALVASELGQGTLDLLVRGVVCQEGPSGEHCAPLQARVSAAVNVGQPAPPQPVPVP
jgi:hypothetical protein